MYVDRGCCRVHGVSHLEQLFSEWADSDMMVRLDIFHWIHRFDAAVRTDHHPKYALFKSALSAVVFSYNMDHMARLIQAIRSGHHSKYDSLSDVQIIEMHVSKNEALCQEDHCWSPGDLFTCAECHQHPEGTSWDG